MELADILKLLAGTVSLVGIAYGALRFVSAERVKQKSLSDELIKLQKRLEAMVNAVREDADKFQFIQEISQNAEIAIGADLHSISIPVPLGAPTHLKIIISSDPNSEYVIGKEFPIDAGLAGRVFGSLHPEFANKANEDPQHFTLVDSAAGTNTGEGGILSYPLISGSDCVGVAQFMKHPGTTFSQEDVTVVGRFTGRIAAELDALNRTSLNGPRYGSVPQIFASILFSDVNDYSSIASNVSLYQAVNLLDEYYRRILTVALRHNAVFEEYLGDGVYLSFHAKNKEETVLSAINCAIEMQDEYAKLKKEWVKYQLPITDQNFHTIGIASGNVFEGTIGHSQFRKRKLIGPAIDRAAHLVDEAKKHRSSILIDNTTYDHITDADVDFVEQPGARKIYLLSNKLE